MSRSLRFASIALVAPALLVATFSAHAQGKRGYYRWPTLHDNTLVFTAEGDSVEAPGRGRRRDASHDTPRR